MTGYCVHGIYERVKCPACKPTGGGQHRITSIYPTQDGHEASCLCGRLIRANKYEEVARLARHHVDVSNYRDREH